MKTKAIAKYFEKVCQYPFSLGTLLTVIILSMVWTFASAHEITPEKKYTKFHVENMHFWNDPTNKNGNLTGCKAKGSDKCREWIKRRFAAFYLNGFELVHADDINGNYIFGK